jgi:hypothetical protein
MQGQRQTTVINLIIPSFWGFFFSDKNLIIANLILLESRAVKERRHASKWK